MDKTDRELKRLERDIKAVYSKAYAEIKTQLAAIAEIGITEDMPLAKKNALLAKKDRLQVMAKQISDVLDNAEKTAKKMIDGEMLNIYEMNYNEDASRLGFNRIDHTAAKKMLTKNPYQDGLGRDDALRLAKQAQMYSQIRGELLTGILKGESIPKIAGRLKGQVEKDFKSRVRIARTETTRAQNSAKMDVGEYGESLGFSMRKKWVATYDTRTRDEHMAMDGVVVDQDEPFILPDGTKMMFPGDISLGADASQVINCRCTMIEFIDERSL